MATDERPEETEPARWHEVPTPEKARGWERVSPGTFNRIMDNLERDYRHDRRLDWAYLGLRAFAILCGSGVIVTLALAAAHLADHGAVVPGLGMFGAATASIVGALVTYTRSGKR